jgi:low affinity Fe/Cu permease
VADRSRGNRSRGAIRYALVAVVTDRHHGCIDLSREAVMNEYFHRFASRVAAAVGTPVAFACALLLVLAWAVVGPIFHFSDTWQLVINTGTTIATFLVVFLIQNTQNRDASAIHLKLDELLHAIQGARNSLIDLEDMSDDELRRLRDEFRRLREEESHPRTS